MSQQVKMHSLMVEKKVINTFQTVFRRITSILTVLSPTLVSRIKRENKTDKRNAIMWDNNHRDVTSQWNTIYRNAITASTHPLPTSFLHIHVSVSDGKTSASCSASNPLLTTTGHWNWLQSWSRGHADYKTNTTLIHQSHIIFIHNCLKLQCITNKLKGNHTVLSQMAFYANWYQKRGQRLLTKLGPSFL